MVYAPNSGRSRSIFARSFKLGLRPDAGGAEPDSPPQRDLKKLILIIGLLGGIDLRRNSRKQCRHR